MRKHFIALLSLGGTLLLGNCQKKDAGPASTLTDKRWVLEQVDGTPITVSSYSYDYDSFIQFSVRNNDAFGLAACSGIKCSYALAASQRLTFSQLVTTPGSCSNLNVATSYLAALPKTERYEIKGSRLLLYDGISPGPRLVFKTSE